MNPAWLKGGAVVAAAVVSFAAGLVAPHLSGDGEKQIEVQIAAHMPDVRDYSFVALPATPLPGQAYIQTADYVDALRSGQVILFEYRPFTVYACSMVPGFTEPRACRYRDNVQLRSVRLHGVVTRYSVGTKSLADARKVAPNLFRTIHDYISTARFVTRPAWFAPYAEKQLRRMYQGR